MAFSYDEDGNITMYQGDSGSIPFEDIPTDKNYKVFFSIYDGERNPVGDEIYLYSNNLPVITIEIPASLTDLLTVGEYDDYTDYYYGLKICDTITGSEDTLLIGNSDIGDLNTLTVYPKKTEGLT